MLNKKQIRNASYVLKLQNPHFEASDIFNLLKIDRKDRNQTHYVHYGIWSANGDLGLKGGYKYHNRN